MITEAIPRHGARLLRFTVMPELSAGAHVAWAVAREWPLWGAIAALVILAMAGHHIARWELDPALVAGYVLGLLGTRFLTSRIRTAQVRLEVATVARPGQ